MKCKICGYEIEISDSWGRMGAYHTGEEENLIPNPYCFLVHSDGKWERPGAMNAQYVATLTDEDKTSLIKFLGD